ncbi:MAG TPA: penicillin-binding transpeptidase domain-containing protein [Terriglobia bacterium]|nr:penicillin-binding transpeptidase domain-containing protein [Terriglobia bacterium]
MLFRKFATLAVAFAGLSLCLVFAANAPLNAAPGLAPQASGSASSSASSGASSPATHKKTTHHRRRRTAHKRTSKKTRRTAASHRSTHHVRSARVHHTIHHRRTAARRRSSRRSTYHRVNYVPSHRYHSRFRHHRVWSPWSVSSYGDPELGDDVEGENAAIREAAIKALGRWNGAIVVVNPNNGRILSLVNQKLALSRGYIPCSTVKPMVALAGLREGVITLNTKLRGMTGRRVNLTEALARSDNRYFAEVGEKLGFERVEEYAHELGYGQKAGLGIPGESAGVFPSGPPPKKIGGVGRLTSFGTGIDQTPLQMAAIVSAIANGGTLYWLQYPRTQEEIDHFEPRVRRVLTNLMPYIPDVQQGMAAAVLYGTARSAYNADENIFGKTGTCSEDGGRMGWFVSFSEEQHPQYVVVVMLRGGRAMFGPHAAEIAGDLYRALLPKGVESAQDQSAHLPGIVNPPSPAR